MNKTAIKTIFDNKLIEKNDTIVIGVSGGADSMSLLHFLSNNFDEYNLKIIVCHINHMLRGEESDRDEKVVEDYCKINNIKFYSEHINVKELSEKLKKSIEQTARDCRYECLEKVAKKYNAKVATAHTLSDKLETFIINFTRGCSLNGLCSIPVKRDNIIRPLIDCSRLQIEEYCKENNIHFIIDSSNKQDIYTRNKIRLNVIPLLKEINPNIEHNINNLIYYISDDNDYLNEIAEKTYKSCIQENKLNLKTIYQLDNPILYRIISIFLKENDMEINNYNIMTIGNFIKTKDGKLNIEKDKYVEIKDDYLEIDDEIPEKPYEYFKYLVEDNNIIKIDDASYKFIITDDKKLVENDQNLKNTSISYIDYDKIIGSLTFRQKEAGDKIKLKGTMHHKTIKKLLNENKIPIEERYKLPLLEDEDSIIWLDEFEEIDRVSIDQDTKRYLNIIKYKGDTSDL